jgi:hypothetical protein
MAGGEGSDPGDSPEAALCEMRKDIAAGHDPEIIDAIERQVARAARPKAPMQPAMA